MPCSDICASAIWLLVVVRTGRSCWRSGQYRLGEDALLTDTQGKQQISLQDHAVAMLDEAEQPRHHRKRFTVAAWAG